MENIPNAKRAKRRRRGPRGPTMRGRAMSTDPRLRTSIVGMLAYPATQRPPRFVTMRPLNRRMVQQYPAAAFGRGRSPRQGAAGGRSDLPIARTSVVGGGAFVRRRIPDEYGPVSTYA